MSFHHHHHLKAPSSPLPNNPNNPEAVLSLLAGSSGYHKISHPLLRRCMSDPYTSPSATTTTTTTTAAAAANIPFEHSLCASRCGGSLPNMSPPLECSPDHHHHFPKTPSHSPSQQVLPPLPPSHGLRRCVSDINPSPAKASSRFSTSSQDLATNIDTPNSKRLRRMKDRLREMSLWCQQIMRDEDLMEEDAAADDHEEEPVVEEEEQAAGDDAADHGFHNNADATDTSTEDESEKEFAECVSVEKKDDCLVVHFKCHCDKAYQFLLSGGECYYKLM